MKNKGKYRLNCESADKPERKVFLRRKATCSSTLARKTPKINQRIAPYKRSSLSALLA